MLNIGVNDDKCHYRDALVLKSVDDLGQLLEFQPCVRYFDKSSAQRLLVNILHQTLNLDHGKWLSPKVQIDKMRNGNIARHN